MDSQPGEIKILFLFLVPLIVWLSTGTNKRHLIMRFRDNCQRIISIQFLTHKNSKILLPDTLRKLDILQKNCVWKYFSITWTLIWYFLRIIIKSYFILKCKSISKYEQIVKQKWKHLSAITSSSVSKTKKSLDGCSCIVSGGEL